MRLMDAIYGMKNTRDRFEWTNIYAVVVWVEKIYIISSLDAIGYYWPDSLTLIEKNSFA